MEFLLLCGWIFWIFLDLTIVVFEIILDVVGIWGFVLGVILGGLKGLNFLGMLELGGNRVVMEADFICWVVLIGLVKVLGLIGFVLELFFILFFILENMDLIIFFFIIELIDFLLGFFEFFLLFVGIVFFKYELVLLKFLLLVVLNLGMEFVLMLLL